MRISFFLRCKVHSVRHTYLFNFYLSEIKCKRPEVNSEPTHFLTLLNNGQAFSSLDGMACSYQWSNQFQFLPWLWQAKRYWISSNTKRPNLFKNNLNNSRYLLRGNHKHIVSKQSAYLVLPSKVWEDFFQTKRFSWEDKNFFGQKKFLGRLF